MRVLAKDIILEQVIKNLLQAQKVAAEKGDAEGVIDLSKEIFYLANKFGKKIIEVRSAESEPDTIEKFVNDFINS